jgi:DNA gyrase subunit A
MAIRFKEDEVRPMGLVAAGVNGLKLADKDEVVGMEILPAEGEIFLITSEGKAKRVEQKEFPVQGRYGRGVIAWDLPEKARLAGVVADKPNHMATIHLTKGAPKSTRLDEASIRKRAATKGDVIVEVKPGEEVVSVNIGWTVEKFVTAPNGRSNGHRGAENGKKNGRVKASANGKAKPSAAKRKTAAKASSAKAKPKAKSRTAKTTSPKRQSVVKKVSPTKRVSKPLKKRKTKKQ